MGDEENTQGDTPEHLLARRGQSLQGRLGLGRSQTNQLGTGKSKGSCDEDGAEALEAVLEGELVKQPCAPVLIVATAVGTTAENQNEADDEEGDNGSELQEARPELLLGVAKSTKAADNDKGDEEDGHKDSRAYGALCPVINREGCDDDFKRQDKKPLEEVVPAHLCFGGYALAIVHFSSSLRHNGSQAAGNG